MSIVNEVCFVVESNEYRIRSSKLARTSTYFSDLLESSKEFSEIRLLLPDWITTRPFQVYLAYLENSRLPKVDSIMAQKILWIADFFKDNALQINLITQQIIPSLNKETVLLFVQDACTKIYSTEDICESWFDLYSAACEFSAKNYKYLLEKFSPALNKLDSNALKKIIEKALTFNEHGSVFDKLIEIKKTEGIVGLIPVIEQESIFEFQQEVSKNLVIDWNIDDFEFSNFYKESEAFKIGNTKWVLCIWCFEHEKRLEISIKQLEVAKEFKQSIAAVTTIVQLHDEILDNLIPKVQAIPAYFQTQSIIREVTDFNPENIQYFSIRLYAKSEDILSALLMNVASRPSLLIEGNVSKVPKTIMLVLVSLKYLNVENEDIVLEIIGKWYEFNHSSLNDTDCQAFIDCIKWDYITVNGIINCIINYPSLKKNPLFAACFKKELENKLKKFNSKNYVEEVSDARKSYKKTIKKENYNNHKEYLSSVFDILLNIQVKINV